jgi:hypothetical protein
MCNARIFNTSLQPSHCIPSAAFLSLSFYKPRNAQQRLVEYSWRELTVTGERRHSGRAACLPPSPAQSLSPLTIAAFLKLSERHSAALFVAVPVVPRLFIISHPINNYFPRPTPDLIFIIMWLGCSVTSIGNMPKTRSWESAQLYRDCCKMMLITTKKVSN